MALGGGRGERGRDRGRGTFRISAGEVRAGIAAQLRAAGPEYMMLAAFVTVATNLIDFATLPAPGEVPGYAFVGAAAVRIVAVFFATYAIERRMAGVAAPLAPGVPFARFFLFTFVWSVAFGLLSNGVGRLIGAADRPLATQWLALFAIAAAWGLATIRLSGWGPALATGAPFAALPGVFRRLRGASIALALAFAQIVLPFAALHASLTLLGVRLPLSGPAFAALALVDGVVAAAQLVLSAALAVTAWRIATRDRA